MSFLLLSLFQILKEKNNIKNLKQECESGQMCIYMKICIFPLADRIKNIAKGNVLSAKKV